MVTEKMKENFKFTSIKYPFNKSDAIQVVANNNTIDEYIGYINKRKIEQAEIIMPDLSILKKCQSLKYLKIYPSYDAVEFDFSPLYQLSEVKMLNVGNEYGEHFQFCAEIDFAKIKGLIDLSFSHNGATLNYDKLHLLKSLSVGGFKGKRGDLSDLFCSKVLDTLELRECKVVSLDGIEISDEIQCLYIYHNRNLKDISALKKVKSTLKALRIVNCSKIEDFSVLAELENLELLELTGSNVLQNLHFIRKLESLKTFIFDMNVLDGDLTSCLNLSYVYCDKSKKHYNLKDKDLPKGKYIRGNESIEEWRRLE